MLSAIVAGLKALCAMFGLVSKASDIQAGVDKQAVTDAKAALATDKAESQAAANAPVTRSELDAALRGGKA